MNFFSKPIFLLASVLLLCSCEFSENIVVNPDGTGSFSVDFDGSALMEMPGRRNRRDSYRFCPSFQRFFEQVKPLIHSQLKI